MTVEVITCEKVMGVEEATALYPQLLTSLLEEKQVAFDCSQIERIDTAALQMLYAFSKAASLYGSEVRWDNASDAFTTASQLLGLTEIIRVADLTNPVTPQPDKQEPNKDASECWDITYRPYWDSRQIANDPVSIFKDLSEMGPLTVEMRDDNLPLFSELEPNNCYLAWRLILEGKNDEQALYDVFGERVGQSELEITPRRLSNIDIDENEQRIEELQIDVMEMLVEEETNQNNEQVLIRDVPAKTKNETLTTEEVDTSKVDDLIELVGEFVVAQSVLSELANNFTPDLLPKLNESVELLQRYTREMHTTVMKMSTLPIDRAFERLPTLVQMTAQNLGKKVEVTLPDERLEIDKAAIENVMVALNRLVVHAINHSLEEPEQRKIAGKSEVGALQINASHEADQIVIEISDDGIGLDGAKIKQRAIERGLVSSTEPLSEQAIYKLIFIPGFSVLENQEDVLSLDVVLDNIQKMGGSIDVTSRLSGGAIYTLRLPLASTIMDGQIITVSEQKFVLPLAAILESFEFDASQIKQISGKGELYPFDNGYIPVLRLYQLFNLAPTTTALEQGLLVIVEEKGQKVGLFVDDILSQQQVVIKDLATHYRKVLGFSGATILGLGNVALILDISGLIKLYKTPSLARSYMSAQEEIAR
jgi:two-component system chemotaxis sensor kinase CheA